MKVIYTYKSKTNPIYIEGSNNTQRVLIVFQDGMDLFVYYSDDYLRHVYLNKVIKSHTLSEVLHMDHLVRIESDDQFNSYINWIKNNYNYDGVHIDEKINGHDLGGSVLVDEQGNTLIKGKSD